MNTPTSSGDIGANHPAPGQQRPVAWMRAQRLGTACMNGRPAVRFSASRVRRGATLRRPEGHWRWCASCPSVLRSSAFLPGLRSTPVTALQRYYAGSDSPALLRRRRGLPASRTHASGHPAANHPMHPRRRFSTLSSSRRAPHASASLAGRPFLHMGMDFALQSQARQCTWPNRVRYLRAVRSPSVAPHPALRRRSYGRVQT